MVCAINKTDSNLSGLAYAEEECLKQLPGTNGADAVWYGLEPNSYSDFGGELTTVARSPIDPSRQNKKGSVTGLDASGGFNLDFTKTNLVRLMQGFMFANARELASTRALNAAPIVITSAAATGTKYVAAAGMTIFSAGHLVMASGFGVAANNGIKAVTSSTATDVVTNPAPVNEASPPAAAKLEAIGFVLASGDANIVVTDGIPALSVTTADFTTMAGLIPGAWIFLGDDTAGNRFADNVGYARIKSVAAKALTFDDTSWTPAAETGTGKTIRIYLGTVIKNEKLPALIKRRSYQFERTLGMGATDVQAEYLEGAVANEFTLNVPLEDKMTADMAFVACDNTYRSGDSGDERKVGTRISALGEDAYNSTSHIYRMKMAVHNPAASNPAALFGYVSEGSVTINNGVTPNKAIGVMGAFDTSAGNFVVGGSLTCYFTTVAAVKAVRANADVGLSIIGAFENVGFIFDIPLLSLGGGRLTVEKDQPIMLPLEPNGAESDFGHTMLFQHFKYLPNLAMAD